MWLYDFLIFLSSGRAVLSGLSPYSVYDFNSPIFLALFFAPLAALPVWAAYGLYLGANLLLAWKLLRRRILWGLLFFPFLFSLYVGQIDFLLAGGLLLSPWAAGLALIKPQTAFVVMPWLVMNYSRRDWFKALLSAGLFVCLSFLVRPGWVAEWLASHQDFVSYTAHASNLYWLVPGGLAELRAGLTIAFSLLVLPLGFLLRERRDAWTAVHSLAPLTNIYSPALLLEWVGPLEVLLSWAAVGLAGGNIHSGMPLFLVGLSILIRSALQKARAAQPQGQQVWQLWFRPEALRFAARLRPGGRVKV